MNTLGAHLDYVVREALQQKGLPKDAANLIVVPGPQLEQVLRSKQVDVSAFGYWQTTFEGATRQAGGLRAVFDDTDVIGEIAGGFVVLRRDWIAAHPDEAKAFVEASAKALDYAREHPEETKAIFAKGLEEPGRREVQIDRAPVHGIGRQRAVIFQEPRLLPWLTVLRNVAFGLEMRGLPQREAEDKARHYIRLVGLAGFGLH